MPRPKKCRKVCRLPKTEAFVPQPSCASGEAVILTVDEYEAIRLIDREGFSQEECGIYMQVARTTVQQIYNSARAKLAEALVEGLSIKIAGGDYCLCSGEEEQCLCGGCERHRRIAAQNQKQKGEAEMKIAVTYENGMIFQHYGHTKQFKLYDVENGAVVRSAVIDTNGSGHGALAGFLTANNVDTLICGGIGGGARNALEAAGIRLFGGASGNADGAVSALLSGKLVFNPDVQCSHHEHEHAADHSCGDHGCGDHGCESHTCGE